MYRFLLGAWLLVAASGDAQGLPSAGGPLASDSSPYAAATASQFAAACEHDQASCAGRVGGVLMSRILSAPSTHICLPGISYARAVGPWLKQHPEAASMNADDGIYLALTTIYKCGPPNNY